MRAEGTPFHVESELLTSDLDIVVEQLEARILFHSHPYDAGPPKVREGADPADSHDQLAMPGRHRSIAA